MRVGAAASVTAAAAGPGSCILVARPRPGLGGTKPEETSDITNLSTDRGSSNPRAYNEDTHFSVADEDTWSFGNHYSTKC